MLCGVPSVNSQGIQDYPISSGYDVLCTEQGTRFCAVRLGDWPQNFGIVFAAGSAILIPLLSMFWPTNLSLIIGALGASVIGFLVAYPFVCEEQAKELAQRQVQKEKPDFTVSIAKAKLNNWTWDVTGWLTSYGQSVEFHVPVSAKRQRVGKYYHTSH